VSATLAQLNEHFSDPRNLMFQNAEMGEARPALNEQSPGLGSSFDFYIVWNGLKFPGRMITVKRDEQNVWFVRDSPPNTWR